MLLSDLSVKRPVFATVLNILLLVFGIVAFTMLPLREYPDIDRPIVSIDTDYPGASAEVVETQVTQLVEDRISGIEGIKNISSSSSNGRSRISIEFNLTRDIDAASNDVRECSITCLKKPTHLKCQKPPATKVRSFGTTCAVKACPFLS